MALESLYIRVTNTTAGTILLDDLDLGLSREGGYRVRKPGPVYVPASSSVNLALSSEVLLSYESGAIRQQVVAGNLTVSQVGGAVQVHTWTYDYSVDGGTVGVKTLKDIQGNTKQIPPCLMIRGWVDIITQPASSGAPTGKIGYTADDDGFVTTNSNIKTGWTSNLVVPFNGAKVNNGRIDLAATANQLAFVQTKLMAATNLTFTIGTAAITAGKFNVHLEILPTFS